MSGNLKILKADIDTLSKVSLDDTVQSSSNLLNSLYKIQEELNHTCSGDDGTRTGPESSLGQDDVLKTLNNQIKTNWNDQLNKPLKQVNSKVKKLDKSMEKMFSNNGFKLDDLYKYKINIEGGDGLNDKIINRSIIIHLLRNGDFEQAKILSKESDLQIPDDLFDKFNKLHSILKEMKQNQNFDQAINWCHNNSDSLNYIGSDLEFQLYKLKFIQISTERGKFEGYQFIKKYITWKFGYNSSSANHLELISRTFSDIQGLGLAQGQAAAQAAGRGHNKSKRNTTRTTTTAAAAASLSLSSDKIDQMCDQFIICFNLVNGLSLQNPLYQVLLTSFISLPIFDKYNKLITLKKNLDWSTKNELPFEINLPDYLKFHPIFICPVSKEETTVSNPPKALPCKHILSESTIQNLSKNKLLASFKCPYCPKISRSVDSQTVKFVNI